MIDILFLCVIFGIPIIFLVLCIKNIVIIVRNKKLGLKIEKSLIIKSIIFGLIFISIILFYCWFMYELSKAIVANM